MSKRRAAGRRSGMAVLLFVAGSLLMVALSCVRSIGDSIGSAFESIAPQQPKMTVTKKPPTATQKVVRVTATFFPSSTVTLTLRPSQTPVPSRTRNPTRTNTPTHTPTATVVTRLNPIVIATETPVGVIAQPTLPPAPTAEPPTPVPQRPNYDHNGDGKVTCKDFSTQAEAQEAYYAGYTNLDGNDNDGKACESLP